MWASAVYDLGLSTPAFLEITPRQFHALFRQHLAAEERMDRRFALLATMYANAHRPDGKRPYTVEDFIPQRTIAALPVEQGGPHYQPVEEQIAMVRMFTETFSKKRVA